MIGASHRLADRRRLRLDDLAAEAFVDFPEGTPVRAPSDLAFAAAGLHREVAFEAMSTDLVLDLVRQNLAVALLSPAITPADPHLRAIPVSNSPIRTEYLAWSDFNPSPAAQAFLELLRSGPA